ncbi:MAG: phospholipid-binding protein MlaC [Chloroflexota bacterium]
MVRKPASVVFFVTLVAVLVWAGNASAGVPTDQIRATVDRVLAILKDPKLNSADAKEARRVELRKAIFPRFDFEEMAKRSLGAEWRRRTPAEQKEFVRIFTELLKDSYVETIESYHGDKVLYRGESEDQGYATVNTAVVTKDGEEFSIDYRLNLEGKQWKVYDVVIENVSIVNNYRSQFSRILSRSSFADLLQKIRAKIS